MLVPLVLLFFYSLVGSKEPHKSNKKIGKAECERESVFNNSSQVV